MDEPRLTPDHAAQAARAPVHLIVDCPECHKYCGWCSWYRKNAREVGCGASGKRKCEFGQAAKGVPCSTCDGSGKVVASITYRRIEEQPK